MMQYKVINADHLRSLEAIVNFNILKGWVPCGGVFCKPIEPRESPIYQVSDDGKSIKVAVELSGTESLWSQAMIRP